MRVSRLACGPGPEGAGERRPARGGVSWAAGVGRAGRRSGLLRMGKTGPVGEGRPGRAEERRGADLCGMGRRRRWAAGGEGKRAAGKRKGAGPRVGLLSWVGLTLVVWAGLILLFFFFYFLSFSISNSNQTNLI